MKLILDHEDEANAIARRFRDQREVVDEPLRVLREAQQMLEGTVNPLLAYRRMSDDIAAPLREHVQMIQEMTNPLADLQRTMTNLLHGQEVMLHGVAQSIREGQATAYAFLKNRDAELSWFAETMRPIFEQRPLREHHLIGEMTKANSELQRTTRYLIAGQPETLDGVARSIREGQGTAHAFLKHRDSEQAWFAETMKPFLEQQRIGNEYSNLFRDEQRVAESILAPLKDELLRSITPSWITAAVSELREHLSTADMLTRSDGTTIAVERPTPDDMRDAIAAITQSLAGPHSAIDGQTLKTSLATLRPLPRRSVAAILVIILVWLFNAIGENEVQYYSGEAMSPVRRYVIRRAKELLHRADGLQNDGDYRLVCVEHLEVRAAPRRTDARIVGRLSFPQLVVVSSARTDWVKIRYQDEDSTIEGWVLARYVTRVKLPPTRSQN